MATQCERDFLQKSVLKSYVTLSPGCRCRDRIGRIKIERREKEMKNIERIKTMSEKELIELFHEIPFDCANQCPDFGYECLETCTHDCGREFIRNWLNEEN